MNQMKNTTNQTTTPIKLTGCLRVDEREVAVPSDGKKISPNGFKGCTDEILANNTHVGIGKAGSSLLQTPTEILEKDADPFLQTPSTADNDQHGMREVRCDLEVDPTGSKGNEDAAKPIFTATGGAAALMLNPATDVDQSCKDAIGKAIGKAEDNNEPSLNPNKPESIGPVNAVGSLIQTPNTADNARHETRTQHEEENTPKDKQCDRLDARPSLKDPNIADNTADNDNDNDNDQHKTCTANPNPKKTINQQLTPLFNELQSHDISFLKDELEAIRTRTINNEFISAEAVKEELRYLFHSDYVALSAIDPTANHVQDENSSTQTTELQQSDGGQGQALDSNFFTPDHSDDERPSNSRQEDVEEVHLSEAPNMNNHVDATTNSGILLHRSGTIPNDQSNKQVIGRVTGDSETVPITFKASASHDYDVVIQNGGTRSTTQGFKRYTKLIEEPYIRNGYIASKNKKQFVIDKVIDFLLEEGRMFYIKKQNIYELLDLTNAEIKKTFAEKVAQKIRDCNKRLNHSSQHEEENPPHLNKNSTSHLDTQKSKHTINSRLEENPTLDSSQQRNQADSAFYGDASRNTGMLLNPSGKRQNDQSNKQAVGEVVDVNNITHSIGSHPDSKAVPITFKSSDLSKHGDDVVIQNGGKRNTLTSNQGFKEYTKLIEEPYIRNGYDASKSKKQFVINKVITPLLKQERHFYIKKGKNLYELIDLTDVDIMWKFAEKVAQKIRDCKNKKLQGSYQHEEKSASNSHLVGDPLPTQALNTASDDRHDAQENLNDQSNKQAIGKAEDDHEIGNESEFHSGSTSIPYDHHKSAVQSDRKNTHLKTNTEGFPTEFMKVQNFNNLTENPSIHEGHNATKDNEQFVIDLLQPQNTADNDLHKKHPYDSGHEINPKRRKIEQQKIHNHNSNQYEEERTSTQPLNIVGNTWPEKCKVISNPEVNPRRHKENEEAELRIIINPDEVHITDEDYQTTEEEYQAISKLELFNPKPCNENEEAELLKREIGCIPDNEYQNISLQNFDWKDSVRALSADTDCSQTSKFIYAIEHHQDQDTGNLDEVHHPPLVAMTDEE